MVEGSIIRRRDLAVLNISDDGIGFDSNSLLSNENDRIKLGLTGMRERATIVGGRDEIESVPKSGTNVFVRVPSVVQEDEI